MQPAMPYHDQLHRASDLSARAGSRFLPVNDHLRQLLPGQALRCGSVVGISANSTGSASLMLTLLAEASKAGSWCAIVGLPTLGYVAAAEIGVVLSRLAIVSNPGPDWPNVLAALIDGFDMVVVAPRGQIAPSVSQQMAARVRQRGSVLVPYGTPWASAEVMLKVDDSRWYGIGEGAGHRIIVTSSGRGAASVGRRIEMWLPAPRGHGGIPAALVESGRARRLRSVG